MRSHPSYAAHSNNTQHFSVRIMSQREITSPFPSSHARERLLRLAEGANHEEDGDVGRSVVDCHRCAGDLNS